MTGFWSGETLRERLGQFITPFDPDRIDCSAYTLAMGREVYVSPNEETVDPQSVTFRKLDEGCGFTIPPGQFAFLLTDELVEVPDTALAFISIKARIKWRGLINVSGFHVDPGFKGRLVFSVFNAGPVPVHLRQGQPLFLIWYADLDQKTELGRRQPVQETFPDDLIPGISGELQSFAGLSNSMKALEKDLTTRVHAIEREQTHYRSIALLLMLLIGGLITNWVRETWFEDPAPVQENAATPAPLPLQEKTTARPTATFSEQPDPAPAAGREHEGRRRQADPSSRDPSKPPS